MRPQDFYTKTRASHGIRVELVDPAGNKEWARIRSVLSGEFVTIAVAIAGRAGEHAAALASLSPAERKQLSRRRRAVLAAALVADWSLPMKTVTEIAELFIGNPRLRRQVEMISENHALHFGADK